MIPYLIQSEMEYRKDRTRKGIAAQRSRPLAVVLAAPDGRRGEVDLSRPPGSLCPAVALVDRGSAPADDADRNQRAAVGLWAP